MVCSCTAAERDILSDVLYVGQVLDGLVRSIHRFGAFVEVQAPSGQQGQVRGLLWEEGMEVAMWLPCLCLDKGTLPIGTQRRSNPELPSGPLPPPPPPI